MVEERDFENSYPFRQELWSEHSDFIKLAAELREKFFEDLRLGPAILNIKLLLVNLYSVWLSDEEACVGIGMSKSHYKVKSRYNPTGASSQLINIIKTLNKDEFISLKPGFFDRQSGVGRLTRIWPGEVLEERFKSFTCGLEDVQIHSRMETVILRNAEKQNIEYKDDENTMRMREVLVSYNDLLARTFIDIPILEEPLVEHGKHRIKISQTDKFVRRIFNNSRWDQGGRFYGGWWQRLPSEYRSRIALDNRLTIEDDYSGIHIVLLYALDGIDYWSEIGDDPYQIEVPGIDDADICRKLAKLFLLVALNAENDQSAILATLDQCKSDPDTTGLGLGASLTNALLRDVLRALRKKHQPIAHKFCSGAGIHLMNDDSKITEYIIGKFLEKDIPILTIHDSYIVPADADNLIEATMHEAFEWVTGKSNIKTKRDGTGQNQFKRMFGKAINDFERNNPDLIGEGILKDRLTEFPKTEGYVRRYWEFKKQWRE